MGKTGMTLAIGGLAAALTLGTAGVVIAAGTQGNGPASVLSSLVSDGTLTQAQADKVEDAFKAQHEERRAEMDERRAEADKIVMSVTGISAEDLESAREEGKTLNEIAGDKASQLKAALVAFMKQETAQAVKDGKLTAEQAEELNSRAEEMVTRRMSGEGPRGFGGPGGPGGHGGPGGPGGAALHGEAPSDGGATAS